MPPVSASTTTASSSESVTTATAGRSRGDQARRAAENAHGGCERVPPRAYNGGVTSPAVSALVVTFNHSLYVSLAIASALAQSRPPLEVVVVDDGSSDDTVARVRALADPRIRLIAGEHRGIERLAETYGRGLEACRGDLLAFLEGDDLWPERKLERQVPHFAEGDVVASHGAYSVIGARGTVLREYLADHDRLPAGRYDALPPHLLMSYILPVTALVRKSALLAAGGFRQLAGTPHWDYPTFLALAEQGPFVHSSDVLGVWRKHGRSGTMELAGRDFAGADLAMALALETRVRRSDRRDLPSVREIESALSEAYARQSWQVGRVLLARRRFDEARSVAWRGFRRSPSLRSRSRLLALCAASVGRVDLERFGRLLMHRSTSEELT